MGIDKLIELFKKEINKEIVEYYKYDDNSYLFHTQYKEGVLTCNIYQVFKDGKIIPADLYLLD